MLYLRWERIIALGTTCSYQQYGHCQSAIAQQTKNWERNIAYGNLHTWGGCATSIARFNSCGRYFIGRSSNLLILEPLRVVLEFLVPHPDLRLDHPLLLLHMMIPGSIQLVKLMKADITAVDKQFDRHSQSARRPSPPWSWRRGTPRRNSASCSTGTLKVKEQQLNRNRFIGCGARNCGTLQFKEQEQNKNRSQAVVTALTPTEDSPQQHVLLS